MNRFEIEKLVSAMEASFSEKIDDAIVTEYWKKYDTDFVEDKLLGEAWNELTHYVTDYDLRNKDPEYEEHMRKKIIEIYRGNKKKTYLAKAEGAMLFLDLPLISMNAGLHGWCLGILKSTI